MMSILYKLGQQHREINALFCELREVISMQQRGVSLSLFQLAAKRLIACMRAEHAVVYPRFAEVAELVDDLAKARRGHQTIEDSINLLRIGGLDRAAWNAEVVRLMDLLDQSVELEELSLFPIAGLALTTNQLMKIGVDFVAHLAHSGTVAGVSITYAPSPAAPRAIVPSDPTIELYELTEADEVIDLDLDETAYLFDRPRAE